MIFAKKMSGPSIAPPTGGSPTLKIQSVVVKTFAQPDEGRIAVLLWGRPTVFWVPAEDRARIDALERSRDQSARVEIEWDPKSAEIVRVGAP